MELVPAVSSLLCNIIAVSSQALTHGYVNRYLKNRNGENTILACLENNEAVVG